MSTEAGVSPMSSGYANEEFSCRGDGKVFDDTEFTRHYHSRMTDSIDNAHQAEEHKFNPIATLMPDMSFESAQTWHKVASYVAIVAYVVIAAVTAVLSGLFFPIALPVVVFVAGIGIMLPLKIFTRQQAKADALENEATEEKYVHDQIEAWKTPTIERNINDLVAKLREQADVLKQTPVEELLRNREETEETKFSQILEGINESFNQLYKHELPPVTDLDEAATPEEGAESAQASFFAAVTKCHNNIEEAIPYGHKGVVDVQTRMRDAATALETALTELKVAYQPWTPPSFLSLLQEHREAFECMGLQISSSTSFPTLIFLAEEGVDLKKQFEPLLARCLYWFNTYNTRHEQIRELRNKISDKSIAFNDVTEKLQKASLKGDAVALLIQKLSTLDRQITELTEYMNQLNLIKAQAKVNTAIMLMYLKNPICLFDHKQIALRLPVHNISQLQIDYYDSPKLYRLCAGRILTLETVEQSTIIRLAKRFEQQISNHTQTVSAIAERRKIELTRTYSEEKEEEESMELDDTSSY